MNALDITVRPPTWRGWPDASTLVGAGVYALVDLVAGGTYIGSSRHVSKRITEHRRELTRGSHTNTHLQRAWTKRGPFKAIVLDSVVDERSALLTAEQFWIDAFGEKYNISPIAGRPHGSTLSEEHRARIGAALTGKRGSEESKEKQRRAMSGRVGRPMSQEHQEKLRRINSSLTRSQELRDRISATLTGRKASPEHRKAISDGLSRHYSNEENRAKVAERWAETRSNPDIEARRVESLKDYATSPACRENCRKASQARWRRARQKSEAE